MTEFDNREESQGVIVEDGLSLTNLLHIDRDFERYSSVSKIVSSVRPKQNMITKNPAAYNNDSGTTKKGWILSPKSSSPKAEVRSPQNSVRSPVVAGLTKNSVSAKKKISPKLGALSKNNSNPQSQVQEESQSKEVTKVSNDSKEKQRIVDAQETVAGNPGSDSGVAPVTLAHLHQKVNENEDSRAVLKDQARFSIEIERKDPEQDMGQLDKLGKKHKKDRDRKDSVEAFMSGIDNSKRANTVPKKYSAFLSGHIPSDEDTITDKSRKSRFSLRRYNSKGDKKDLSRENSREPDRSGQESNTEEELPMITAWASKSFRTKSHHPKTRNFIKRKSLLFGKELKPEELQAQDPEDEIFSIKDPEAVQKANSKQLSRRRSILFRKKSKELEENLADEEDDTPETAAETNEVPLPNLVKEKSLRKSNKKEFSRSSSKGTTNSNSGETDELHIKKRRSMSLNKRDQAVKKGEDENHVEEIQIEKQNEPVKPLVSKLSESVDKVKEVQVSTDQTQGQGSIQEKMQNMSKAPDVNSLVKDDSNAFDSSMASMKVLQDVHEFSHESIVTESELPPVLIINEPFLATAVEDLKKSEEIFKSACQNQVDEEVMIELLGMGDKAYSLSLQKSDSLIEQLEKQNSLISDISCMLEKCMSAINTDKKKADSVQKSGTMKAQVEETELSCGLDQSSRQSSKHFFQILNMFAEDAGGQLKPSELEDERAGNQDESGSPIVENQDGSGSPTVENQDGSGSPTVETVVTQAPESLQSESEGDITNILKLINERCEKLIATCNQIRQETKFFQTLSV